MSMLRRRVEAKRMGTQRPVAGAQKTVASRRVVAGLGIVLDQTGSEQFMDEIDRRVSFKARFAKETRERQEKLAEMRGEVATAQRKAIAAKVKSSRSSLKTQMQSDKRVPRSAMGYFDHLGGKTESDALSQLEKYIPDLVKEYRAAKTSDSEVGQSATADKGNGTKLPIPSKSHRAGVRARHQTTALWHDKVQNVYADIEELRAYDEMYGLLDRINKTGGKYESIEALWEANPEIKGSTNPKDFGMYRAKAKAAADLSVAVPEGVSPEAVEEGAAVEKEHGTTYNQIKEYYAENGEFPPFDMVTEWIASDHLKEFADYYEALEAMEKELKAEKNPEAKATRTCSRTSTTITKEPPMRTRANNAQTDRIPWRADGQAMAEYMKRYGLEADWQGWLTKGGERVAYKIDDSKVPGQPAFIVVWVDPTKREMVLNPTARKVTAAGTKATATFTLICEGNVDPQTVAGRYLAQDQFRDWAADYIMGQIDTRFYRYDEEETDAAGAEAYMRLESVSLDRESLTVESDFSVKIQGTATYEYAVNSEYGTEDVLWGVEHALTKSIEDNIPGAEIDMDKPVRAIRLDEDRFSDDWVRGQYEDIIMYPADPNNSETSIAELAARIADKTGKEPDFAAARRLWKKLSATGAKSAEGWLAQAKAMLAKTRGAKKAASLKPGQRYRKMSPTETMMAASNPAFTGQAEDGTLLMGGYEIEENPNTGNEEAIYGWYVPSEEWEIARAQEQAANAKEAGRKLYYVNATRSTEARKVEFLRVGDTVRFLPGTYFEGKVGEIVDTDTKRTDWDQIETVYEVRGEGIDDSAAESWATADELERVEAQRATASAHTDWNLNETMGATKYRARTSVGKEVEVYVLGSPENGKETALVRFEDGHTERRRVEQLSNMEKVTAQRARAERVTEIKGPDGKVMFRIEKEYIQQYPGTRGKLTWFLDDAGGGNIVNGDEAYVMKELDRLMEKHGIGKPIAAKAKSANVAASRIKAWTEKDDLPENIRGKVTFIGKGYEIKKQKGTEEPTYVVTFAANEVVGDNDTEKTYDIGLRSENEVKMFKDLLKKNMAATAKSVKASLSKEEAEYEKKNGLSFEQYMENVEKTKGMMATEEYSQPEQEHRKEYEEGLRRLMKKGWTAVAKSKGPMTDETYAVHGDSEFYRTGDNFWFSDDGRLIALTEAQADEVRGALAESTALLKTEEDKILSVRNLVKDLGLLKQKRQEMKRMATRAELQTSHGDRVEALTRKVLSLAQAVKSVYAGPVGAVMRPIADRIGIKARQIYNETHTQNWVTASLVPMSRDPKAIRASITELEREVRELRLPLGLANVMAHRLKDELKVLKNTMDNL